jgi:hypothetical protein
MLTTPKAICPQHRHALALDAHGYDAVGPAMSNNLKKALLICSHLQQFSEIISPPNRPLPATQ